MGQKANTFNGNIVVGLENSVGFGIPTDPQALEATGPRLLVVQSNPNGTVIAPRGTLAIDASEPALWQNTDGLTTWTLAGGSGGGASGEPVALLGLDPAVNPTPVVASEPSRASGTATVNTAPLAAGDEIDINGNKLTGTLGPRTSGGNDYDASLGTPTAIALDMIQAINDPANAWVAFDDVLAFSGGPGIVTIQATTAGSSGNAITLTAATTPGGNITVSGGTLTGGGVGVPTTLTFETPSTDLLLKQLFIAAAADELIDASIVLLMTSISVDGGPNLLTGTASVPLVGAVSPASSPELNIPLPASSVVTVVVENVAPRPALAIASWTAVPLPSPPPAMRMLLGIPAIAFSTPGTDASADITVTAAASVVAGDVLLLTDLTGGSRALTGAPGPRTSGANDFDTSGTISAIVASIVAAINDPANDFDGYIATDLDPVVRITDELSGSQANTSTQFEVFSAGMTPSVAAFSGGTNGSVTLVFPAAPADAILERLYLTGLIPGGAALVTDALILDSISIDGGPNLIEGESTTAILSANGSQASPVLDIPIGVGEVVTVVIASPVPSVAMLATWTTRAP
jgi:hypothetical protein